jgi:hypothetical protein
MADEMFTMKNQCATVAANPSRRYNQFQSAGKSPGKFPNHHGSRCKYLRHGGKPPGLRRKFGRLAEKIIRLGEKYPGSGAKYPGSGPPDPGSERPDPGSGAKYPGIFPGQPGVFRSDPGIFHSAPGVFPKYPGLKLRGQRVFYSNPQPLASDIGLPPVKTALGGVSGGRPSPSGAIYL